MCSRLSEFCDLKFMTYFECPFKFQNPAVEKVDIMCILPYIWEQEKQWIFWKNANCYFSACIKPQTIALVLSQFSVWKC